MIGSGRWAITVNKMDDGYQFTVLLAVDGPGDLLRFRPLVHGDKAYEKAEAAWLAGAFAMTNRSAREELVLSSSPEIQ